MELIAYTKNGWHPLIRPASPRREWMDRTGEQFAYRCLPMDIANAHGWEILTPVGFDAMWGGTPNVEDLTVRPDSGPPEDAPVSLFGYGIITFHVHALFRTSPGWSLFVGGPLNSPKEGIAPLSGVIETDWVSSTFTMNWKFLRRNHLIRFEAGEPFCHLFPVQRGTLEQINPKIMPMDPETERQFDNWSKSRRAFQTEIKRAPPTAATDKWEKQYYRGIDMDGKEGAADHTVKLRLQPFKASGSS